MKLKIIHESRNEDDEGAFRWIDPDTLYGYEEATTFIYTGEAGLWTIDGDKSHYDLLLRISEDPAHKAFAEHLAYALCNNYDKDYAPFAINGRSAPTALLDRFGAIYTDKDIGDGSFVSLWNVNELLPQCMLDLYNKGIIDDPVYLSCPQTGTTQWQGQAMRPTGTNAVSPTEVALRRELHNLRGDDKRAAMLKLGLNPYSKKHEWTAALQKANIVGPGQDWWRMQSESIRPRRRLP